MTGKEKILTTALHLFSTEGYERTSVQRLAEASGVSQGLLYRHFRSKDALLLHFLQEGMAQIAGTLLPYRDVSLTARQAYEQHIGRCIDLLPAQIPLWKTLHTVRHQTRLMDAPGIKIDFEKEVIQPIAQCIERSGHRDSDTLAWTVVSLIDGITGMYLLHPDIFPLEKIGQYLKQRSNELFSS